VFLPLRLWAQVPDTITLKPVVVTATRLPMAADALAAAVTVIRGADLRAAGVRTVADALRQTPAAAVVESGSFGSLTSLFLRGGESDYVKVLVDGVPQNLPGGSFDWSGLTTDNVERIEIVRGPASVLYGSDAVTGVIQVFTRTGRGAAHADADVEEGSYGLRAVRSELSGGGSAVTYSASASRFETDGIYPFNNQYGRTVLTARVRVAPDPRTDAALTVRHGDRVFHFPTTSAGQPVDSNQFSFEHGPTVSFEGGRVLGTGLEVRLGAGVHEVTTGSDNQPDSPGDTLGFYGRGRDRVRRLGANVRLNWQARPQAVVTVGIEGERERQRGRSESQSRFGAFTDSTRVTRGNGAIFAQVAAGAAGPWSIQAGARLDRNEKFGSFGTVRLGLARRLDARMRARAAVGTAFKEPTFIENYGGFGTVGNPNLAPERSRSWEVGVEREVVASHLNVALTYFAQRFRDLIEFTSTPTPPDTANYFNITGASADGLEATLEAVLPGGALAVSASYTYLRTQVTNPGFDSTTDATFAPGRPLLRRPAHTATLSLVRPFGSRGSVRLATHYVGRREDRDFSAFPFRRVVLAPYTRVDVAAYYDLSAARHARPGLALQVRIENVFDAPYEEIRNFAARRRVVLFGGGVHWGS
jgi:vitamin B12 transporter